MALNIPEYYKDVSLRLGRVLDTVGLEEDIRWQKINMWIQTQKMNSVTLSRARFLGSQGEATTTPELKSDVDIITLIPYTVIQNLESWVPEVPKILLVSDENTRPGYAKLQNVHFYLPLLTYNTVFGVFKVHRYGRSVICNDNDFLKFSNAREYHGPASTAICKNVSVDYVYALRLHTWPYHATGWITRNRYHNWPSQKTIDLIQQTGALLVPVGHTPLGPEKTPGMANIHFIWRETSCVAI
ncbi:hypothetical protein CHS0354_006591 [Potamilus streckersoni]|uniref:Mab-21-like nucleotidyltransferase domain-containing protein n=1 Tax=Potamilus streckersoni TaxID=2493646 RepID=A0AAE0SXH9_9BIVA|nr:hypothetical protein CHS0354_006591 [Potamilus streckersoni]